MSGSDLKVRDLCRFANNCIALGVYTEEILDIFDHFSDLSKVTEIRRIGAPSNNGFVTKLTFEDILSDQSLYQVDCILKSVIGDEADNLAYEYFVGLFINQVAVVSPFFTRTYGLYLYKDFVDDGQPSPAGAYTYLSSKLPKGRSVTDVTIRGQSRPIPVGQFLRGELGLEHSRRMPPLSHVEWPLDSITCDEDIRQGAALLMEFVPNSVGLDDLLSDPDFVEYDLLPTCLLIYATLSAYKQQYTHYDLHPGNVLMIPCPMPGGHFAYRIKLDGQTVIGIRSRYLPKLIDYGRSYFSMNLPNLPAISSETIHEDLCVIDPRPGMCCEDRGLWLDSPGDDSSFYVKSSINNQSYDLRLINIICGQVNTPIFKAIQKDLVFKGQYGTPSVPDSTTGRIETINDLSKRLLSVLTLEGNRLHPSARKTFGMFDIDYRGTPDQYPAYIFTSNKMAQIPGPVGLP